METTLKHPQATLCVTTDSVLFSCRNSIHLQMHQGTESSNRGQPHLL